MKTEKFKILDYDLNYYVGLSRLELKDNSLNLDQIIEYFSTLERDYKGFSIQILNDELILNEQQIYSAVYYVQKAFLQDFHLMSRKNLELLLYLAANRQIKNGFKDFGVSKLVEQKSPVILCIISSNKNLKIILNNIVKTLNAKELELGFEDISIDKLNRIRNYYNISNNQIKVLLKSYYLETKELILEDLSDINEFIISAFNELINEKMVGLILEQ